MSKDVIAFKSWLDAYGQAWRTVIQKRSRHCLLQNGAYQVTPFLEPMFGKKAIFEYWSEVTRIEENVRFRYEILIANADLNIAR
jgi:hypothetical protein